MEKTNTHFLADNQKLERLCEGVDQEPTASKHRTKLILGRIARHETQMFCGNIYIGGKRIDKEYHRVVIKLYMSDLIHSRLNTIYLTRKGHAELRDLLKKS